MRIKSILGFLFLSLPVLFLAGCGGQVGDLNLPVLRQALATATANPGETVLASLPTTAPTPSPLLTETAPAETPVPAVPTPTLKSPASTTLTAPTAGPASLPAVSPTAALVADPPGETATPAPGMPAVVGYSAGGRPIFSYRLGQGPTNVVFVGGVHGGYEWNTILLAYQALDYFLAYPEEIPQAVSLFIIPNANPDGLYAVTGRTGRFVAADVSANTDPGRFNGNGVDLNRNWDCQWQPTGLWRNQTVSGGSEPFSELENQALSQFLLALDPAVVLFLHSAAEGVYAAGCPETDARSYELAIVYGVAAGYPIYERFEHYEITGDAGDWLVTQGIPSITAELKTHEDLDWAQNLAGMLALLAYYQVQTDDLSGPMP